MPSLMASLLPRVSRAGRDTTTSRLSATLMSLSHTLQLRLFAKEETLNSGTGFFCILKWNPIIGLALPLLIEGKD